MLVLIDKKLDIWIDHDIKFLFGKNSIKTFFLKTRIQEALSKGLCRDFSFKRGKESLVIYDSGLMVVTHVSAHAIREAIRQANPNGLPLTPISP